MPKKVPKPLSWMDYGATGPLPTGKSYSEGRMWKTKITLVFRSDAPQ